MGARKWLDSSCGVSTSNRGPFKTVKQDALKEWRRTAKFVLEDTTEADWKRPAEVFSTARSVVETLSTKEPASSKPGRPARYGENHFKRVAQVYREAEAQGLPPTKTVAQKFSTRRKKVTHSQAAKWVAKCREEPLGLLPPTTRGMAKGQE